jgi:LysR family transcriptional regulator, glycine cleavage system transcriptional activator
MARHLPPMLAVRSFEAAARHGSFARAAEELCVSAGAVGHQVRTLEEWVGSPLFVRGARSVELTEAGHGYFDDLKEIVDDLERVSLSARSASDPREVTVSAMPSFVTRWLMPRLGKLRALHPDIEVRLLASVPPVDFARDRVDLAIRLGTGPYPDLVVEPLMTESFRVVGNVETCGRATRLEHVLSETLLHDEHEPRIPKQIDWTRWCSAQGLEVAATHVRHGLHFSHTYLTLEAAAAGQGLALASDVMAADAVWQGRLSTGPGGVVAGPYAYRLLATRATAARKQVTAFSEWIQQEAQIFSRRGWAPPA